MSASGAVAQERANPTWSRGRRSRPRRPSSAFGAPSAEPSARSSPASLEELAAWYRDLVVVVAGAESAVVNADRVELLRADASEARGRAAEQAAELVRESWRVAREFNVNASLALEALFIGLRREFRLG